MIHILQKGRKTVAMLLAFILFSDLFPALPFMPTVQAAILKSPPTVQAALEGDGHGENGRFIAPVASPVSESRAISSPEELQKIGTDYPLNGDYHLTADIDLDGIAWEPIEGTFTGTLDGQGHVIRNLSIVGDYSYAGLFARVGGVYYVGSTLYAHTPVFKNLGMESVNIDVKVATSADIGGLFAYNQRGHVTVSNCYADGQITGEGNTIRVGGLIGRTAGINPAGILNITDCYNAVAVTAKGVTLSEMLEVPVASAGSALAGGVLGVGDDAKNITNCHNVGVIKADSSGFSVAGGISARLYDNETVVNSSNAGDVSAVSAGEYHDLQADTPCISAGGVIGMNSVNDNMSTIVGCYNTGSISAELTTANDNFEVWAGGIGGRLHEQTLNDCFNTGNVSTEAPADMICYAAGIAGNSSAHSSVRRCWNIGAISGKMPGAIIGLAQPGNVTRDNFWQAGSAPEGIAEGEGESGTTALTATQMKQEASFSAFNFMKTWGFKEGENDGYLILQAFYPDWTYTPTTPTPGPGHDFLATIEPPKAGSYPIGTVEELQNIGQPNGLPLSWDYHLTANIDLEGTDWKPIGENQSNGFTGTFDGQGYAIHNMEVVGAYEYAGLFGVLGTGGAPQIKNLGLENVYVNVTPETLHVYAGGLVGYSFQSNAVISNCYVGGDISATGHGHVRAAGIIAFAGVNYAGEHNVADCFNTATVTANGSGSTGEVDAGGVLGYASARTIRNCRNEGKITANSKYSGIAGGIVAWLMDNETIRDCSNTGDISATTSAAGTYVSAGGVVARNNGENAHIVTACYNTGNICAESTSVSSSTEVWAGGIGGMAYQLALSDCFNTGNIAAENPNNTNGHAGGIVGRSSAKGVVYRCYSTGDVSAAPYPGGIVGLGMEGSFIRDCYWNDAAGQTKSGSPVAQEDKKGVGSGKDTTTPLTAVEMKQEASFFGFHFAGIWGFKSEDNDGYPILRAFAPGLNYVSTVSAPISGKDFLITDFANLRQTQFPLRIVKIWMRFVINWTAHTI